MMTMPGPRTTEEQAKLDQAFCNAARHGSFKEMKHLYSMGANIDAWNQERGCHAIHHAIEDKEKFHWMLKNGASVNVRNGRYETVLMHLINRRGSMYGKAYPSEDIDIVIAQSLNLDIWDEEGKTALALAIQRDENDLAEKLLDSGASLEGRCKKGPGPLFSTRSMTTPLLLTMEMKKEKCFALLLKRGADLHPPDKPHLFEELLHDLAQNGHNAYADHYHRHRMEMEHRLYQLRRDLALPPLENDPGYKAIEWNRAPVPPLVDESGQAAPFLIQLAGLDLLPKLFQEEDWKNREPEALALYERLKAALPSHYQDQLELTAEIGWARRVKTSSGSMVTWARRENTQKGFTP